MRVFFPGFLFSALAALSAFGQLSYTGGVVSQDFNTLPSSGTFTLTEIGPAPLSASPINAPNTAGWFIQPASTTIAPRFRVDAGGSSTAAHLSSGSTGQGDRALGMLASGSYIGRSSLVLINNTGGILTELAVTYTGEQWRNGGSNTPNTLTFAYSIDSGAFITVGSLQFTSPVSSTTAAALDGNATGNRTVMAATITNVPWGPGQTLTLRWADTDDAGSDDALAIDDVSFSAVTGSLPLITRIHSIQGTGVTSPMAGNTVTVEALVTGDFQGADPALGGFYLRELPVNDDADVTTSQGIFVDDDGAYDVQPGDIVRVTASVVEVSGVTTLMTPTFVGKVGSAAIPSPVPVSLPAATTSGLERYEGMLVQFSQTLTVTSVSQLGPEGRLTLASGGAVNTPTNYIDPNDVPPSGTTSTGTSNASAINSQESFDTRRKLILDDASIEAYPDITPYFNAQFTRRCGDTTSTLTGFLSYSSGDNKLQPTVAPVFVDSNPRPSTPPTVGGRLKIASMNALNYFTTLGSRGATNTTELQRQQDKLVAQIIGLNADVLGLIEIENNGTIALDTLIAAVNANLGSTVYARVPEPAGTGGDLVRVAFIYKPSTVTPDATSYTDGDSVWNRWPLAVTFTETSTSARFIACVNHFKAKAGSGATGLDVDQNDGQGAFNERRRQQAARLITFLTAVRSASGTDNVLVLGDLNANTEEDPVDMLRAAGYADQLALHEPGTWSYNFDAARGQLDHALATSSLTPQLTGAAIWHINADEPAFLDYSIIGKTTQQQTINVGTFYRASDHDPVIVGLNLTVPTVTYATWAAGISWPPGADTSPTGDADNDNLANVLELLTGSNPLADEPQHRPFVSSISATELSLDYRHRENVIGFQLVPQWSPDLVDWDDLSHGSIQSTVNATTALRRLAVDITGHSRGFLRLIVR
ncbi:MAG: ExeM/NucH family extracellular endonuclease [Verrucomicrobiaceae bacterium]|nr:ExeM/NucH family extracellular endonuclease [Verrucomicrobiaceae bacterium]